MNSNMKNKNLTQLNSNRGLLKSNNSIPKLNKNKKYKKYKKYKINNYIDTQIETKINKKNTYEILLDDYLEKEFKDMAFDEIIKKEKRSFCEYFGEQIRLNLIIIN